MESDPPDDQMIEMEADAVARAPSSVASLPTSAASKRSMSTVQEQEAEYHQQKQQARPWQGPSGAKYLSGSDYLEPTPEPVSALSSLQAAAAAGSVDIQELPERINTDLFAESFGVPDVKSAKKNNDHGNDEHL